MTIKSEIYDNNGADLLLFSGFDICKNLGNTSQKLREKAMKFDGVIYYEVSDDWKKDEFGIDEDTLWKVLTSYAKSGHSSAQKKRAACLIVKTVIDSGKAENVTADAFRLAETVRKKKPVSVGISGNENGNEKPVSLGVQKSNVSPSLDNESPQAVRPVSEKTRLLLEKQSAKDKKSKAAKDRKKRGETPFNKYTVTRPKTPVWKLKELPGLLMDLPAWLVFFLYSFIKPFAEFIRTSEFQFLFLLGAIVKQIEHFGLVYKFGLTTALTSLGAQESVSYFSAYLAGTIFEGIGLGLSFQGGSVWFIRGFSLLSVGVNFILFRVYSTPTFGGILMATAFPFIIWIVLETYIKRQREHDAV